MAAPLNGGVALGCQKLTSSRPRFARNSYQWLSVTPTQNFIETSPCVETQELILRKRSVANEPAFVCEKRHVVETIDLSNLLVTGQLPVGLRGTSPVRGHRLQFATRRPNFQAGRPDH